jgi:hypothetical protein
MGRTSVIDQDRDGAAQLMLDASVLLDDPISVMRVIRPRFIWRRDDTTTLPTHPIVYAINPATFDILSS